jgi:hypothetical protein
MAFMMVSPHLVKSHQGSAIVYTFMAEKCTMCTSVTTALQKRVNSGEMMHLSSAMDLLDSTMYFWADA